ncbi:MAG TPA: metallophosphoesterase [Nitrososphaeraceae archaeon]|nr:metallophosphoesterase [Nitrososphaeraceae archaeon]
MFSITNETTNYNNESNITKKNFVVIDNSNNNTVSVGQNQNINQEQKIKIIAAGDFGCRPVAQNNIKQIELQQPDIFLVLGDLSYEPTMNCWYEMTKALDSKIKIAIGNHEDEEEKEKGGSKELKDSLLQHYTLPNSYYSFNYGNVHILVLDTQLEFSFDIFKPEEDEEGEGEEEKDDNTVKEIEKENKPSAKYYTTTLENQFAKYKITDEIPPFYLINEEVTVEDIPFETQQYQFALNDLKNVSTNSSIDWIIVMLHKPLYSSLSSHIQEYIVRDKFQPIFDKYGVDLVLQGHNHFYDRTLPLQFNPNDINKPIVDGSTNKTVNKYINPEGSIYSVVGLGGRTSHIFLNQPDYVVNQHNGFGFLAIDIEGKELDAKYYDIGYKCKEQKLKESDMEEGDFTIFEMSSCKKDNSNDSLEVIDHYSISKSR